jgi:putative spermidine/putrescine transport system substrate-binding protein
LPADFAAELPSSPANLKQGIRNDAKFWAEHLEDLQARFQAWLSK